MGPYENPTPEQASDWEGKTRLEIYDPATDSWSEGTPAPQALSDGASCSLGDRIFFMGGELANATLIYDVAENSWSEATPSPTAREGLSCARLGDALFLFGGRDPVEGKELGLVERYDIATDTWQPYENLPTGRYWFSTLTLGESIYALGGENLTRYDSASAGSNLLRSVEILSPAP